MSDENLETKENLSEDSNKEESTTGTTAEISEIELKAREMGWKPAEDYDDPDHFIDAEEFVRRKPLFDKIDSVNRELKETKKALRALQDHHAKVREAEYSRALAELKDKKKQILADGDADALIEIDEQIMDLKAEEKVAKTTQAEEANKPHPNFINWVNKNAWYAQDAELRAFADAIGISYARENQEKSPDEVLDYVARRVKQTFKDKFRNQNQTKASAVEGSSGTARRNSSHEDDFELSDEERKIMNTFVRSNVMSKEEYIAELKRVKGQRNG